MNFGLLLPHLPNVQESRTHYDAMLRLQGTSEHRLEAFWNRLKALVS